MLDAGEEYHDLATLVRRKAEKNGRRPALRFEHGSFTFAELDRETERVAAGLLRAGVLPGERVATLLFNTPEFPLVWFGAAKARAVLVPLNTGLKGEILRYELADSAPRALVVDTRLWPAYAPLREGLRIPREYVVPGGGDAPPPPAGVPSFAELPSDPPPEPPPPPRPNDPASVMYTSGTTGPPKGAIIPHQKLITTPVEIAQRSHLTPESVLFTALPLFHCNAQEMTTLSALLHDLPAAFDERFHASTYWETATRVEASHVSLLISMVNILFKQPERPADRAHHVRIALTAGTTKALWPEFEKRFGLTIVELYGMTECGCTTLMNPPGAIRLGSVGTTLGFVEADVVDDDDRPVRPNVRGELVVRPRAPFTMFLGYLNQPEKTVESWRNLWFHTGDTVTRDEDGYFYFVDRKKDIIRRRGENLAPYDVESVLNLHPGVFESVVVGVPSPLGEEDVKAYVQAKPGVRLDPKELFEFCVARLPFFMVPRFLEFLDEIPKTANQKSQRYLLRQRTGGTEYDREQLGVVVRAP
jgi:carnitine-CoA ligase